MTITRTLYTQNNVSVVHHGIQTDSVGSKKLMEKCLSGAKLEHHCSSPLNGVSKNVCSCELHSAFVTKICTATTLSCLDAVAELRSVTL